MNKLQHNIALALAVVAFSLSGCEAGKNEKVSTSTSTSDSINTVNPVVATTRNPEATAAQWKAAIAGTHEKTEEETDGEGVSKFYACFMKRDSGTCQHYTAGKQDAFRGIQFFYSDLMEVREYTRGKPALKAYISLLDCKEPVMIFEPIFKGPQWLFMNQAAVMVDGKVVLDKRFDKSDRDNDHRYVREAASLLLTRDEFEAFRAVTTSSNVIIRLTGDKGYVTVDKKTTSDFSGQLGELYFAFDALSKAAKSVGPVNCNL